MTRRPPRRFPARVMAAPERTTMPGASVRGDPMLPACRPSPQQQRPPEGGDLGAATA